MLRPLLLTVSLAITYSLAGQSLLYQSSKMTDCIISAEQFQDMKDQLEVAKIKSLDPEHQVLTEEIIPDFKITINLVIDERSGLLSYTGDGETERQKIKILEIEKLSETSVRYKYKARSADQDESATYLLVHDEAGRAKDFLLWYDASEAQADYEGSVSITVLENIASARLKGY